MSLNRITLLGNVGKDPEVRTLTNGGKVASFNLATTERGYTKKDGVQMPERTEWHNIVIFKPGLVDVAEKYIRKGTKLYIEGMMRTRSYEGNDGTKRYVAEVHVESLELLGQPQPTAQPKIPTAPPTANELPPYI